MKQRKLKPNKNVQTKNACITDYLFFQATFIFSISENESPETYVGTLQAEDRDGPLFNSFLFAFFHVESVEMFKIDAASGIISTRRALDRERQAQYQLAVVAYDPKLTSMSSTASVVINVLDKNDNRPEFVHFSKGNNSVLLSNKVPVGHVVTQVKNYGILLV